MGGAYLWAWDGGASDWVKVLVDSSGHLQADVLSQPDVAQGTPESLKHVPHGYYPTGGTYHPLQVDSAGKLLLTLSSLARLNDIDDVYVPSPTDEYFLYWDAPNSRWACRALVITDMPSTMPTGEGARAYHSANQTISNETYTILSFDSERYDTDTIHDTVTNNSRLTCKTAGKYVIIANVQFTGNATGHRSVGLFLNGTTWIAWSKYTKLGTTSAMFITATIYDLAVDDYVEVKVYQDSGGDLNVLASAQFSNEFMMQRIG